MALVSAASATPASSSAPTISLAFTAGDLGFAMARLGSALTITSVDDNLGSSWTVSTPVANGAGANAFAYRANVGSATSLTWHLSAAGGLQLIAADFSSVLTSAPLIATSTGSTGNSTGAASDATVVPAADAVVLGLLSFANTETFVQNGNWLIASTTPRAVLTYQQVSASGSYASSVSGDVSTLWIGQTIAFQMNAAGGGIVSVNPFRALMGVGR